MTQCSKDASDIGCECTQTHATLTSKQASGYIGDYLEKAKALPPKAPVKADDVPDLTAVITLLAITGMTHKKSYSDIFVVAVAIPVVATITVIVLGSLGL